MGKKRTEKNLRLEANRGHKPASLSALIPTVRLSSPSDLLNEDSDSSINYVVQTEALLASARETRTTPHSGLF